MNGRSQITGWSKLDFAERDKCKPVLLRLSLAGNQEKLLMSLYETEWREHGYGLRYYMNEHVFPLTEPDIFVLFDPCRLSRGSGGTASLDYFLHHLLPDKEEQGEEQQQVEYDLQQELRQQDAVLNLTEKCSAEYQDF
jgi:hypothetical protein